MQGFSKVAIAVVALAAILILGMMYDASFMTAVGMVGDSRPIVQLQSGKVISETFADGTVSGVDAMKIRYPPWFFDGSARVRGGEYDISQVAGEGLYVGVSDPNPLDNTWSGIFVMSPNDYSSVYHVTIHLPPQPVSYDPADYANLGMYVQTDTSTGRINYVACIVDMRPDRLVFRAESGLGNADSVTSWNVLWEREVGLDQTEMDCTLITNGDNHMAVIINGERVFESHSLNLQMPRPFNAYLETQVTGIPQVVYGRFTDYYSTFSSEIRVIRLEPGQQASLGNVTAFADSTGTARLDVSSLPQPYSGTLTVYSQRGDSLLAKDNFMGGDLYSYGPVNWIERASYQNKADGGGKILQ